MNDALSGLMDLIAMAISVLAALVLTFIFYKKEKRQLRAIPFFFVLFGPTAVAVHMAMHFVGVGIVASRKIAAGSFVYDFRFYSLLLMAGVLTVLSLRMIHLSKPVNLVNKGYARQRFITCGWMVLVAAPTIPFTFIGSLPVQAVIIHLAALFFVVKKIKAKESNTILSINVPAEVAV